MLLGRAGVEERLYVFVVAAFVKFIVSIVTQEVPLNPSTSKVENGPGEIGTDRPLNQIEN